MVTNGRISISLFISFVLLGMVKRMPCNGQDLCMSCSSWMLFFSFGGIRMKCRRQLEAPSKKASWACQASSEISDSSTSTMELFLYGLTFNKVPCKVEHSPARSKLRTAKSPSWSRWYCKSFTSTWHSKCQAPLVRNHFRSFATAAGVYASLDTGEAWTSKLTTGWLQRQKKAFV